MRMITALWLLAQLLGIGLVCWLAAEWWSRFVLGRRDRR